MTEKFEKAFVIPLDENAKTLSSVVEIFVDFKVSIQHIESRLREADEKSQLEVYIRTLIDDKQTSTLLAALREVCPTATIYQETEESCIENFEVDGSQHVPWFPKHISDLDKSSMNVLMYGKELDADHPSFKDPEYRKRRIFFAEIANNYRYGDPIPRVEYTEKEKATWKTIYCELMKLYEKYACREYLENMKLLHEHAGYKESDLPQLDDVSKFLKRRTGFTLRPVAGYLSSRDFLAGLAFRVFYCTQYIRHEDNPWYTPEPDCCHELLGHMPLFADPTFAQFSQELGLASLGTTDEEVKKLATCYFFSVEFGLCRQNGELRAYGAGLLSSAAELKFALSDQAKVDKFIPERVMHEEMAVTSFQNRYFETPSLEVASIQLKNFIKTLQRPFEVIYDPYTESVEVVDKLDAIGKVLDRISHDISIVKDVINKKTGCAKAEDRGIMNYHKDSLVPACQ